MPLILVAVRWLHFASIFALLGCCFFWVSIAADVQRPMPRAKTMIRWIVAAAVTSGLAAMLAMVASMSGSVAEAVDADFLRVFFLETPFGPVIVLRFVLLAALVGSVALPMDAGLFLMIVLSAALLISQAWLGHAAEGGATVAGAAMIASYAVHVLAGAAWTGGLPALLFGLARGTRDAVVLLRRFAAMATIAVCAIIVTGIVNAGFRVGWQFRAFIGTRYGAILLCKLVLVGLTLCLAALNRFLLVPRLVQAPDKEPARRHLRLSLLMEMAFGALVLGAASILGVTPPPQ